MAKSLQTLITNSSARGEIDNLTDATWTVWINDGRLRLRDLLASTGGNYFETTDDSTFTTVVGQERYNLATLPNEFLRLLAVEIKDSNGHWISLQQYRHDDRNLLRNIDAAYITDRLPRFYSLQGTQLSLLPEPQEAGRTIRLRYIEVPAALSDLADTISGIEEYYSEFIEIWAVLQAKMRLEGDTLPFERMLTRARDRITKAAPQRDSNSPPVLGGSIPRSRTFTPFRGW